MTGSGLGGFDESTPATKMCTSRLDEARDDPPSHPQDWYELCEVGHQLACPQGRVDVGQRVLLLLEGEGVRGGAGCLEELLEAGIGVRFGRRARRCAGRRRRRGRRRRWRLRCGRGRGGSAGGGEHGEQARAHRLFVPLVLRRRGGRRAPPPRVGTRRAGRGTERGGTITGGRRGCGRRGCGRRGGRPGGLQSLPPDEVQRQRVARTKAVRGGGLAPGIGAILQPPR